MNKHSTDFIQFIESIVPVLSITELNFGLQLDFEHQNQVKSIFFHHILANHITDIKELNQKWIIWEDLWIEKNSIVKASIRAVFGLNKTIHGRKTELRSVSSPEAQHFLSHNHILPPVTGKFRLGLYYNNQLVGLMSISAGRNWKEKEGKSYEIIRFCNHKDYRVHGGFSKLLKRFISQKNPVQLMTYADSSWYQGSMYEQFGFTAQQQNKIYDFRISSKNFQRKLALSTEDNEQEWMKVVNYKSYKFTWES